MKVGLSGKFASGVPRDALDRSERLAIGYLETELALGVQDEAPQTAGLR